MKRMILILFLAAPVFSQWYASFPIPWMDHTDGVSVVAMGRGGASIAISDDAAGVWSNPAGIAGLTNSEASLGLEGFRGRTSFRYDSWYPILPRSDQWNHYYVHNDHREGSVTGLGYVAAAKPIKIGERTFVFWAGYRPMVEFPDMKRSWTYVQDTVDTSGQVLYHQEDRYASQALFSSPPPSDWGMALAGRLLPRLNFGIHLHYLRADEDETWRWSLTNPASNSSRASLDMAYHFEGLLWDIGIQFDAGGGLRFGAVYRSGMKADMDYQIEQVWGGNNPQSFYYHSPVHWPDGWGIGAAWQIAPAFQVALDYSRTNWSKAVIEGFNGGGWPGLEDVGYPTFGMGQKDTSAWRVGAEYRPLSADRIGLILRAGYMRYAQNVASGVQDFQPIFNGFTMGATWILPSIRFDAAYMHVSAKDDSHYAPDAQGHMMDSLYRFAVDRLLLSATVPLGK